MNLRFILGRAGSGKTHYVMEKIRDELKSYSQGTPIVLLVPEQATFQMEYFLTVKLGLGGSIRAQVLSFRRLAHKVLLEAGGASRIPIGEVGKRMALRRILEENKYLLRIFGKTANKPGFTDCLAKGIGELKTYLITPEKLKISYDSLGQTNNSLLSDKLFDLHFLYKSLEDYLSTRYVDPDDYLQLLAYNLKNTPSLKGAEFWIDGFKGFTPQELLVIESIFQISEKVNISLCINGQDALKNLREDNPFFPVWETYRKLVSIAERHRMCISESLLLNDDMPLRFMDCPDIAHLEKHLYTYPGPVYAGDAKNITVNAGSNRRAEVESCSREIIRLVRDCGYRWRDIAVNLRDLESYYELIGNVFKDYEIPYFIDKKHGIMHHPAVELIRSALETVIRDWSYEPVFRYLKTDLVPVGREDIYKLENYVIAHGIRGSKWNDTSDWNYRRRFTLGEEMACGDEILGENSHINNVRRKASDSLINFENRIKASANVRQMTAALYELLNELEVAHTVEEWRKSSLSNGDLFKAREHAQVWDSIIGLFDELVEGLGDDELSLESYALILDAGFESIGMGIIPPGLDQVTVGSLDRSRSPEVKAVFILGVNEGIFPARIREDGLFTDVERDKMESLGLSLSPGSRQRSFEEQYIVYTALTAATQRLYLFYPAADEDGRAMTPSYLINRVKELIPTVEENTCTAGSPDQNTENFLRYAVRPRPCVSLLAQMLREAKEGYNFGTIWLELYNWYVNNDKNLIQAIIQSVFHTNQERPLLRDTSRSLYGNPLKSSVSRIERFRSCPYAHFAAYGLRLKDREMFGLEAPDMGEFYHAALKKFADILQKEDRNWAGLSRQECIQLTELIVDDLAPQLQSEILLSTARYRYLTAKIKKAVAKASVVLSEHSRQSKFHPVGIEVAFGPGELFPPIKINLSGEETLEMAGRIDRVDVAESDEEIYVRVIDYKSGFINVKLEDICHGLKLQLLTYLLVSMNYFKNNSRKTVKPGGILYFTVKNPMITGTGPLTPDKIDLEVLKQLKMRGFLLSDPELIEMTDGMLTSGHSSIIKGLAVKNDGSFYSNAPVIGEGQFSLLCSYIEKVCRNSAFEILNGGIKIEPYRQKSSTACKYCDFKPLCKFDNLLDGNHFRNLTALSKEEVWEMIGEGGSDCE